MTEVVTTLAGQFHGIWEVRTWSALHVFNFDSPFHYVVRTPFATGAAVRREDGEAILVLSVLRCEVGEPMRLMLDFRLHGVWCAIRTSNPVQTIERVDGR